jgi:hypothetical protein
MYKLKNIVYADGGKILTSGNFKGYHKEGNLEDFEEVTIDLSTIVIVDNIIKFNDDFVEIYLLEHRKNLNYAGWKKEIISWLFNNDDQIAIILNKDSGDEEDILRYNKMQEWREWAGQLAHKILEILNINNN